jgi:hypothetical protein
MSEIRSAAAGGRASSAPKAAGPSHTWVRFQKTHIGRCSRSSGWRLTISARSPQRKPHFSAVRNECGTTAW